MRIRLQHYTSGSFITLLDGNKHLGSITYTQKAHKPLSEIDYKTLVTEDNTYSDSATLKLFKYLQATR